MFGRFRRLRNLDMKRIESVPSTILAACVLHNICIEYPDQNVTNYLNEGLEYGDRNNPINNTVPQDSSVRGVYVRNRMVESIRQN